MKDEDQKEMLERAKKTLGYNNAELAKALGKSEFTIKAWLATPDAAKRREMPKSARLLLRHVLAASKK